MRPNRYALAMLATVYLLGPSSVVARAQSDSEEVNQATILQWIASLESDTYSVREYATEQLIAAGGVVIGPVVAAVEKGELETIARGNYVLRQLAITDTDTSTQQRAIDALVGLADRRFTGAARRASASLQTIYQVRQRTARTYLVNRGAAVTAGPVQPFQLINGLQQPFLIVQFGPNWRGTIDDLQHLGWLTRFQDEHQPSPWMVIMEGRQVTDEWIAILADLQNVGAIKIKSAHISDASLATLASIQGLELVELMYNSLTDKAYPYLARLKHVKQFRLIGNKMTRDANTAFAQQVAHAIVDFKYGGFLGVRCEDTPCRVSSVQPNSAAEQAGVRPGDIIVGYNQQPVQTMTQLTEMISRHAAGETVTLELQRGAERVERKVNLGAWE